MPAAGAYSMIKNRSLWCPSRQDDEGQAQPQCPELRLDIIEGVSCLRDLMLELNSASVDAQAIDLMSAGAIPVTVAFTREDFIRLIHCVCVSSTYGKDKANSRSRLSERLWSWSKVPGGRSCQALPESVCEGTAGLAEPAEPDLTQAASVGCHLAAWLKEHDLEWSLSVTGWALGRNCCYLDVLCMDMDLSLEALCQWLSALLSRGEARTPAVGRSTADSPAKDGPGGMFFIQPMVKGSMVSAIEFSSRDRAGAGL